MVKTRMFTGISPRLASNRARPLTQNTRVIAPGADADQAVKRAANGCRALAKRVKGGFDLDGDGKADVTGKQWKEIQARMAG